MVEPEYTQEELESEEWRPVVGYEGWYSVSNLGRVRRDAAGRGTWTGRIVRPFVGGGGYLKIGLSLGDRQHSRRIYVHLLVAMAFLGPAPIGCEVDHEDFRRRNPRASNLRYATRQANSDHSLEHRRRGSLNHRAKLTESDAETIYHRLLAGESRYALADEFHVDESTIRCIATGKTWTHIRH